MWGKVQTLAQWVFLFSYSPPTHHRPEFPDSGSHPRRFSWRRALRHERPQPELPHQGHVRKRCVEQPQTRWFERKLESCALCFTPTRFCLQVHHQNCGQAWDPQRDHWQPKGMMKLQWRKHCWITLIYTWYIIYNLQFNPFLKGLHLTNLC